MVDPLVNFAFVPRDGVLRSWNEGGGEEVFVSLVLREIIALGQKDIAKITAYVIYKRVLFLCLYNHLFCRHL